MKKEIESILKLDKIAFDKIEFRRTGYSSEKEIQFQIEANIAQKQDAEVYRVNLILKGLKPGEYDLEISLVGFFTFQSDKGYTGDLKNSLISKNAVAILMPYLRSEVSLLTAQPGMDCVVLPVFNINKIIQ